MLESFDFRNHFCLVFDLLGMSMYDFLRCVAALLSQPPRGNFISKSVFGMHHHECVQVRDDALDHSMLTALGSVWNGVQPPRIACEFYACP